MGCLREGLDTWRRRQLIAAYHQRRRSSPYHAGAGMLRTWTAYQEWVNGFEWAMTHGRDVDTAGEGRASRRLPGEAIRVVVAEDTRLADGQADLRHGQQVVR